MQRSGSCIRICVDETVTMYKLLWFIMLLFFFFQVKNGIREVEGTLGVGNVYKRQTSCPAWGETSKKKKKKEMNTFCLLYKCDAAEEKES